MSKNSSYINLLFSSENQISMTFHADRSLLPFTGVVMEDKPKEIEILELEELDDNDFFQLSQEIINKNIIYSNMDL